MLTKFLELFNCKRFDYRLVCVIIFIFSWENITAQCSADAGANVTICQGESVQLGGNPTAVNPNNAGQVTFDWNNSNSLNNDQIANPIATPNQTTTYTVQLSGGGCNNEDDQITVTVIPAPNANFTYSPNNQPCANTPISFTNTTTGCNGCQYQWDFGDGSSISTQSNPTHTFSSAIGSGTQNFTVTLTVTAQNGCTDTFTQNITIKRIPDIDLIDPITSFTNCNGDPTFTVSVSENNTVSANSFTIVWGDGSSNWTGSSAPSGVSHSYSGQEVFDLVYTVTAANGCSASETYFVSNITNPSIGAANPGGTQGCGPLTICFPLNNFDNNHSSTTYLVDFGDGSPTQSLNHPPPATICHTYTGSSCVSNAPGYTFSITATNNCDQSVATIFPVKVYAGPTSNFTINPNPACVNSSVTFTNTSTPGYNNQCSQNGTYTWNFGDGSANVMVTNLNPQSHVYTTPGTYTVTLIAANYCGGDTITHQVCVEPAPTPAFTVNQNLGCLPMTVTTNNTSVSPNSCSTTTSWIVDYVDLPCDPDNGSYSFAGGTSASSLNPQFTLSSVGTYTLRLRMTNACGIFEDNEVVTVNTVPVVNVTTPAAGVCVGGSGTPSAIVDNCNLAVTYLWTFTNGTPATATTSTPPAVTYNAVGAQNVTLAVTNACGTTSDTDVMNVQPAPNVAISSSIIDLGICSGSIATLNAAGANAYSWSPSTFITSGNGSSVVTISPTSTITYTVTGTTGSCTDTETISLTIDPLPIVAPSGSFATCAGSSVPLGLNVSSGTAPYTTYNWTPTASLSNASSATPTASPASTTTYTVQVTDSEGCVGTGLVPVTVNPLPNTFAGNDVTLCNQPVATPLTGFSPTSGGTGTWTGSPNLTSAGVFTPNGTGTFTLTYSFTNTNNCTATDQVVVTVTNPTAANAGPDQELCAGSPAFQLPAGTWSSSTQVSTTGLYTPINAISDTLIVIQGTGSCADTDSLVITVHPLPVVNAGVDNSICAGSSSNLAATCTTCPNGSIITWSWSGGLGSTSNVTTPNLNATSNFTITGTDSEGCTDTDQVTINVNPVPNTFAGNDITLCNQPVPTPLSGTPVGGTWTGTGVTPSGIFTPNGEGQFTLTYCYTDPNTNCQHCDDMVVTVNNAVTADAGNNQSICQNQSLVLTPVTAGGTWSSNSVGLVASNGSLNTANSGTFLVYYNLGAGTCLTQDSIQVVIHPAVNVVMAPDPTICLGDTAIISAAVSNGTGPYQYSWTPNTSLSNANTLQTQAFPANTSLYTLMVTDANSCQVSGSITVNVTGLPVVNAGPDLTLCDQPIAETLTGFSPTSGGTGTWTGPGITNASGEFTSPGIGGYWVYYTFTAGGNSCSNTDSILITVNAPQIANAGNPVTLCLNEGQYTLQGFSPTVGATWSGPSIINSNLGILQTETAGSGSWTYYLEYGSGTCYTIDSVLVTIQALPNVTSGPGNAVCGNAAIFNLSGFTPPVGGTWEGTGIINPSVGTYDPSLGGLNNPLMYWYFSPLTGCGDTAYTSVQVATVPVTNFTLPAISCTNAPVAYVNLSTNATSYLWDYGNGASLTGTQPNYSYPAPIEGVYDITLIATNAAGCKDTIVHQHEVINPPQAALTMSTDMGCAPLNVSFGNGSIGQYLTYNWNLSINSSASTVPPDQTYLQGNDVTIYPISLTATNSCGQDIALDTITVMPQPIAGFGTNLDQDCSPFEVQFNNISTGLPDTYTWFFGDGTTTTQQEPIEHTYFADTTIATYNITMVAINECGTDTAYYTISVLPNTVTSFFNTNITSGCEPLTVEFTDYSDGATQVSYNLGDGNFTGNDNPTHTYPVGDYTIYQYADNGCSYDTAQIAIQVLDAPQIDFDTDVPNMCVNNAAQFIPTYDSATDFLWNFGDGASSDLSSPSHFYTTGGNFVVSFTATNAAGCSSSISHPFTVYPGPQASFTVPNQLGCSPFTLCVSNTTSNGLYYNWDFGDGNTASSSNACNTYTNVGNIGQQYTVSLIVEDLQLCADTFTMDITVAPQPVSAFTLSSYESCYAPQSIDATNFSLFANGYEWRVDGDSISDIFQPTFQFTDVAEYTVELIASNQYGCSSISDATYSIYPLPDANFSADLTSGCVPVFVNFTNNSTGALDVIWDFGDGDQSFGNTAYHEYYTSGTYDISLIAITDEGCRDTLTQPDMIVANRNPIADFHYSPDIVDIYDPTYTFINDSQFASFYDWDFGDGGAAVVRDVIHTFPQEGAWNVTLHVTSNAGCTDEITKSVVVEDVFNVFVPNTFTPDDDGINEVFLPHLTGRTFLERYELLIYDRWGTVLFRSDNPDEAWTGEVRGGDYYVKDDAYNWQITVQLIGYDEERVFRGHVNILR